MFHPGGFPRRGRPFPPPPNNFITNSQISIRGLGHRVSKSRQRTGKKMQKSIPKNSGTFLLRLGLGTEFVCTPLSGVYTRSYVILQALKKSGHFVTLLCITFFSHPAKKKNTGKKSGSFRGHVRKHTPKIAISCPRAKSQLRNLRLEIHFFCYFCKNWIKRRMERRNSHFFFGRSKMKVYGKVFTFCLFCNVFSNVGWSAETQKVITQAGVIYSEKHLKLVRYAIDTFVQREILCECRILHFGFKKSKIEILGKSLFTSTPAKMGTIEKMQNHMVLVQTIFGTFFFSGFFGTHFPVVERTGKINKFSKIFGLRKKEPFRTRIKLLNFPTSWGIFCTFRDFPIFCVFLKFSY